jgi:hypothetical protein
MGSTRSPRSGCGRRWWAPASVCSACRSWSGSDARHAEVRGAHNATCDRPGFAVLLAAGVVRGTLGTFNAANGTLAAPSGHVPRGALGTFNAAKGTLATPSGHAPRGTFGTFNVARGTPRHALPPDQPSPTPCVRQRPGEVDLHGSVAGSDAVTALKRLRGPEGPLQGVQRSERASRNTGHPERAARQGTVAACHDQHFLDQREHRWLRRQAPTQPRQGPGKVAESLVNGITKPSVEVFPVHHGGLGIRDITEL